MKLLHLAICCNLINNSSLPLSLIFWHQCSTMFSYGQSVGGHLPLRPPNQNVGGDVSPRPPYNRRPWFALLRCIMERTSNHGPLRTTMMLTLCPQKLTEEESVPVPSQLDVLQQVTKRYSINLWHKSQHDNNGTDFNYACI